MTPLLPFAAGLIVGAAAVTVIRSDTTRKGLSRAGSVLRETGESGLAAVTRSAEVLKRPFTGGSAADDDDQSEATAAPDDQAESAPPATPARTRARSSAATAKTPAAAAKGGRKTSTRPRRKPAASENGSDVPSDDTPGDSA